MKKIENIGISFKSMISVGLCQAYLQLCI